MTDRIKALEDALRTKAAMIELGDKIAWGSDVALMREAADTLAASQPAPDCHQPDLVTADSSQPAQPVAWLSEVHNKYQTRGGYDERIDVDEWRQTVMLNEPNGARYRNIRPLYPAPQPLTVQDAARVPEIAALIEAATAAKPHIRGALGFTLNAALRAIAEGK